MRKSTSFIFVFLFVCAPAIMAQWASNPNATFAVCDTTGEQALAKIAVRPDGGCYVSWFDSRNGSYAVYMQNLDLHGNKLWASGGLLISNNPQNTSLVDYDLEVDNNGNAIIAFTDIREGSLKPYIYKISPSGQYSWGGNGVGLSTGTVYQADPKITVLGNGNIAVIWILAQNPYKVGMHILSSDGVKLWGDEQKTLQDASAGFSYPDLVPSDSGSFIVFHTVTTGNFPAQTVKLRAQKVSSTGTVSWSTQVQDNGRIAAFSKPKVISDKLGGGIIAWHDDRDQNNIQAAFAQRVKSDGSISYTVNGIELAADNGQHKFNPVISFDPADQNLFSFWLETDGNQNSHGVSGQMVNASGSLQWGAAGKVFKPLSAPFTTSLSSFNTFYGASRIYAFYLNGSTGGNNNSVEGFAVNTNGDFQWTGDFVTLSAQSASKLQMTGGIDPMGNSKLVWGDTRLGDAGIYGQDISPAGQLGNPVIPVELVSFRGWFEQGAVLLTWSTATETNNSFFTIERRENNETGWLEAGRVNGAGTTTEQVQYEFREQVSAGKYTYRLRQTDYDGSVHFSPEIEVDAAGPDEFMLYQNYPNPFNPSTVITFTLPAAGQVSLKLYDMLGSEIALLAQGIYSAGRHSVSLNAESLSAGVYYYRLSDGSGNVMTRKLMLVK